MTRTIRTIVLFAVLAGMMRYIAIPVIQQFGLGLSWYVIEAMRISFVLAAGWHVRKIYQVAKIKAGIDSKVFIEHGLDKELAIVRGLNTGAAWCEGYRAAYSDLAKVGNRPDLEAVSAQMLKVMLEPSTPETLLASRDEMS